MYIRKGVFTTHTSVYLRQAHDAQHTNTTTQLQRTLNTQTQLQPTHPQPSRLTYTPTLNTITKAILAQVKLPAGRFTWDEAKATIARAHSSLSDSGVCWCVFQDGVLKHPLFVWCASGDAVVTGCAIVRRAVGWSRASIVAG